MFCNYIQKVLGIIDRIIAPIIICFYSYIYLILAFFHFAVTSVYISIVATLLCPSISYTERKSAPLASKLVAQV